MRLNTYKTYLQRSTLIVCFFVASITAKAQKQFDPVQSKAITEAILNYVEGVYNMDTARIYASVHPELSKRGFAYSNQRSAWSQKLEMNFKQLLDLTRNWNKDGKNANAQSPRVVEIYDIQDKTATAKVTAAWGTDYFHLAYLDDKWQIVNVLWQTPPRK